ncbi:MAG: hypothetical protein AMJ78_02405 [Omnitrophica WOR_2 bacterium SM23_29]|nr:MAG: hypothetical protein AMJ78_02405 [Omnitrophica WOR_2 bacterium SM23_29]
MFINLRKNFITGLAVLFPVVVTIWFIRFIVVKSNALVLEPLVKLSRPYIGNGTLEYLVKIALFIIVIFIIMLIGFGTRVLFLRKFFSYFEKLFYQVPMAGRIYSVTKDMSQAFLGQSKGIFSRVVLVEFPRKGIYSIGFVTSEGKGEVQEKTEERVINVFVPTTPNPTSGYLLLVPEGELTNLDMSIADGMKLVVSGGMVTLPEKVKIKKKDESV